MPNNEAIYFFKMISFAAYYHHSGFIDVSASSNKYQFSMIIF